MTLAKRKGFPSLGLLLLCHGLSSSQRATLSSYVNFGEVCASRLEQSERNANERVRPPEDFYENQTQKMASKNEIRPRLVLRGLEEEIHSLFGDASLWTRRLRDANFGGADAQQGALVVRDLIESASLVAAPTTGWNCWNKSGRAVFDPLASMRVDPTATLSNPAFSDSLRAYQNLRKNPRVGFEAWRKELLQNPGGGNLETEAGRIARLLAILEAALRPSEPLDAALGIDFRVVEGLRQDPAFRRLGFLVHALRFQKRKWDEAKSDLRNTLKLQRGAWPDNVSTEPRYPFFRELASFRDAEEDATVPPS